MKTQSKNIEIPFVAPYAIECLGTDRLCYEVIRVISEKTLEVRRMKATIDPSFKPDCVAGGFTAHVRNQHEQTYTFESDPEGRVTRLRRGKARDSWKGNGRHYFLSDSPVEFFDFNF